MNQTVCGKKPVVIGYGNNLSSFISLTIHAGATENAKPCNEGGHSETFFSVRVTSVVRVAAHYNFMFVAWRIIRAVYVVFQ